MSQHSPSPTSTSTLAAPILSHMEFIRLHLLSLSTVRQPKFDEIEEFTGPVNATDEVEAIWGAESDSRNVFAFVKVGVKSGEAKEQLFELQACYRVIYRVKDTYTEDDRNERAIAFCKAYALAHVWPYWRELLASLCSRMDLPMIMAPLLIVGANKPPEMDTSEAEKSKA